MSVEQYQRTVNSLDKELADLEKKKATADKKAADEAKKAANVTISKNASAATLKSKMSEVERHRTASNKAASESADLQKKIADKRSRRNDAYLKLQKEQQKEQQAQQKALNNLQRAYEDRIAELESKSMPTSINPLRHSSEIDDTESSEEYDAFISHAWEDKEDFVDELVSEMKNAGIKVWYDTTQLRWGDSMRQRIDEGLKKSKFGIVVLSPNYIAEGKYWTKAELNGLFQLESTNGKTILPIWYNLNKQDVINFSPMLSDVKAMTTALMTAKEMALELASMLNDIRGENNNGKNENAVPESY